MAKGKTWQQKQEDASRFEDTNRAGAETYGFRWLDMQRNMIAVFRSFGMEPGEHRALIAQAALSAAAFHNAKPVPVRADPALVLGGQTPRYETRAVLGGAYPTIDDTRALLTHTVDASDGAEPPALCERVKRENIGDGEGTPGGVDSRPTCPVCLRRDPRFA